MFHILLVSFFFPDGNQLFEVLSLAKPFEWLGILLQEKCLVADLVSYMKCPHTVDGPAKSSTS